eukprot:SAG31_NODE_1763_length_7322_cov_21.697633_9_plen_67_part_00
MFTTWKQRFSCPSQGNGDAFTSFLLGDFNDQESWPANRPPLSFSDSEYAYVGLVANIGNVLGVVSC